MYAVTAGAATGIVTAIVGGPTWAILGFALAGALIALGVANLVFYLRSPSVKQLPTPRTMHRGPLYQRHERNWHNLFALIPLRDAAIELRSKLPRRFILERARQRLDIDRVDDSPDELLNNLASYIATYIPIYGRAGNTSEGPSKIGLSTINSMAFSDGATTLKHIFYPGTNDYTDLCVKYDEFHALLADEQMQVGYEGESE